MKFGKGDTLSIEFANVEWNETVLLIKSGLIWLRTEFKSKIPVLEVLHVL